MPNGIAFGMMWEQVHLLATGSIPSTANISTNEVISTGCLLILRNFTRQTNTCIRIESFVIVLYAKQESQEEEEEE